MSVIYLSVIHELGVAFPCSMLVNDGEFIPHRDCSGGWFSIVGCDVVEAKAKAIEWLSRDAFKTEPYHSEKKNREYHRYIRDGLNRLLFGDGDSMYRIGFDEEQWEAIYTHLGNALDHAKTLRFIESGYDGRVLVEEVKESD